MDILEFALSFYTLLHVLSLLFYLSNFGFLDYSDESGNKMGHNAQIQCLRDPHGTSSYHLYMRAVRSEAGGL